MHTQNPMPNPRDDRRREDNGDDFRFQRRPRVDDSGATWVRWASVLMVGMALSALGFVVQLSNRMTAVEVKMDEAQIQRKEQNDIMRELASGLQQLRLSISGLTVQFQSLERSSTRTPGRMFDK